MLLKIGQEKYEVVPSFMTLLRYRIEYGVSFFEAEEKQEALIVLIYIAIYGDKPYLHIFQNQCKAESSFDLSALQFYKALLVKDRPEKSGQENGNSKLDEFEIMALALACHIPEFLLNTLNLFQLTALISKYCEIKSGREKPHEMGVEERKALYNISPERKKKLNNIF